MFELIEVIIVTNYHDKFVKNNILTFKSKAFVITNNFYVIFSKRDLVL